MTNMSMKWAMMVVVLGVCGLCGINADMMDMPSDPVTGEMVMSTKYNFQLKNGQRLRFANEDTLKVFLANPSKGVAEAKSIDNGGDDQMSASALCPVCGMETSAHGGPQVSMQHGEQTIHTCSMFHAHQVADDVLSFRDTSVPDKVVDDLAPATSSDFCTGPGTTMLNGFSFSHNGGTPCILLWFPGWILNTPWRYILGCIVIGWFAIFNEYLLHIRRVLRKESNWRRMRHQGGFNSGRVSSSEVTKLLRNHSASQSYTPSTDRLPTWFRGLSADTQHLVHCFLHGFTILLAYMLMLVSMTYDAVLFLCCIVGYIVGYYIFGERREAMTDSHTLGFP